VSSEENVSKFKSSVDFSVTRESVSGIVVDSVSTVSVRLNSSVELVVSISSDRSIVSVVDISKLSEVTSVEFDSAEFDSVFSEESNDKSSSLLVVVSIFSSVCSDFSSDQPKSISSLLEEASSIVTSGVSSNSLVFDDVSSSIIRFSSSFTGVCVDI